MTGMTPREVGGQFYELFSAGDVDGALAVCADDLEVIDPGMGPVHGLMGAN